MDQADNKGLQEVIDFYEEVLATVNIDSFNWDTHNWEQINLGEFLTRADLYHLGGILSVEWHSGISKKMKLW